jgi:hypothetical protein
LSEHDRLNKLPTQNMVAPHFCNVDLEIESRSDLTGLRTELGCNVVVLPGGPVRLGCFSLRLETAREHDNPDDTICAFCSLLEQLSRRGTRVWGSAHKKVFDIGYEVVPSQPASQFSLRTGTLKRLSHLGATLGVTFYNHPKDEQNTPVKTAPRKRSGK